MVWTQLPFYVEKEKEIVLENNTKYAQMLSINTLVLSCYKLISLRQRERGIHQILEYIFDFSTGSKIICKGNNFVSLADNYLDCRKTVVVSGRNEELRAAIPCKLKMVCSALSCRSSNGRSDERPRLVSCESCDHRLNFSRQRSAVMVVPSIFLSFWAHFGFFAFRNCVLYTFFNTSNDVV